jgi:hypothetical protein
VTAAVVAGCSHHRAALPQPTITSTSAVPVSSASGFPDATTAGVPPGVRLTARSSTACNWVVTGDNTVIDGVDLAGCVDIEADNVTIRNSRITSNTWWGIKYGVSNPHVSGLRVLHSTVASTPGQGPDSGGYDFGISQQTSGTLEVGWADISGYKDGVDVSTGSVHDSYIHDLSEFAGAHTQAVYVYPGAGLSLTHNTLINQTAQAMATAAIYIAPDAGHQHDVTVSGSLLAGGAFVFYGGDATATNIKATGNSFSTRIWPKAGYYGWASYWTPANAGNVWQANVWADGPNQGQAVEP